MFQKVQGKQKKLGKKTCVQGSGILGRNSVGTCCFRSLMCRGPDTHFRNEKQLSPSPFLPTTKELMSSVHITMVGIPPGLFVVVARWLGIQHILTHGIMPYFCMSFILTCRQQHLCNAQRDRETDAKHLSRIFQISFKILTMNV